MAHDLARKRPRSGPKSLKRSGAQGRNRTTDTRIFSPLLYRLSYLGSWGRPLYRGARGDCPAGPRGAISPRHISVMYRCGRSAALGLALGLLLATGTGDPIPPWEKSARARV